VLALPARPEGAALLGALLWLGLVYGVADALLLNVLPVLAVDGGAREGGSERARLARALVALAASLLVTAAYHVGFPEFRGARLVQLLIGNAIITAAYLLTGSPLAAVVSHVVMHGAAVVHGMETTPQPPPHY
jgi:hypothetical protein